MNKITNTEIYMYVSDVRERDSREEENTFGVCCTEKREIERERRYKLNLGIVFSSSLSFWTLLFLFSLLL